MSLLIVAPTYPDWSPAGKTLASALSDVGLRLQDCKLVPPAAANRAILASSPECVLAVGDDAARALLPHVHDSVQTRRGYIEQHASGTKVVCTIDPQLAFDVPVPWRILLSTDLKRAREECKHGRSLVRPRRDVVVVDSAAAASRAVSELARSPRLACDIEIYDSERLACIGFAGSGSRAYVFAPRYAAWYGDLLRGGAGRPRLCFQNGQFDLHFLLTRCGIRVDAFADDTLIGWHACYPELAGASYDTRGNRKGAKRTHKSLAFFASIYTRDAWWKDYEFASDHEMYVLNGRDCCITFDAMEAIDREIDTLGVRDIYRQEIALIWPCVEMQARGLHVDETLRLHRIAAIEGRIDDCDDALDRIALPAIAAAAPTLAPEHLRLFEHKRQCGCCGGGKLAREACWRCAGFAKKPGKRALVDSGLVLEGCQACGGLGYTAWLEFNGRSVPQKAALLYEILKLPKRYDRGKLKTDEDTLKHLLAFV